MGRWRRLTLAMARAAGHDPEAFAQMLTHYEALGQHLHEVSVPMLREVHYRWNKARDAADLPGAHLDDLRHAGVTLAAQIGATTAELMSRGGHSTAAASMGYQHAAAERDGVIAQRLSALAVTVATGVAAGS